MKLFIFLALVVAGVLFLPDTYFYTIVKRFIPITGDGEYGMNNFEMTVFADENPRLRPRGWNRNHPFSYSLSTLIEPVTYPLAIKSWTAGYPMESIS